MMNSFIEKLKTYSWESVFKHSDMQGDDYESLDILINKIIKQKVKFLEIGTNQGSSAALFGLYAKAYTGSLVTIDKYSSNSAGMNGDYSNVRRIFYKHMSNLGICDYIIQLHTSSEKAVNSFEDGSFDLIFIDGSHLYLDIKKDLDIWYPKVKSGGIFCGHDCEILLKNVDDIINYVSLKRLPCEDYVKDIHPGVVKAVSEKFPNANIEGYRIWWVNVN